MRNLIKGILRSLGIKLEDVTTRRTHVELSNGVYRIDNIYSMMFVYENRRIEISLAKLGTKDMNIALFNYDDDDGVIVDHHVQELADITAEELYKIIKEFINIGGKKTKGKRYILDIESLYQGEVVKRNTRVFGTYKDLLYSVEKYIKNTYEFGKYVRYKEGNKEIVIVSDIWDYTGLILKFEGGE